jgi:predicted Fe-Mo cluster-binding NifX family protein
MAKIAISAEGPSLDEALDSRFGRAAGFVVVDPQTLDFTYLDNGAAQTMAQGAGIQAAEIVAKSGAEAVLTGFVGPKAFRVLQTAGIQVAHNLDNMTVRRAIELFANNAVDWARQPNRGSHGR